MIDLLEKLHFNYWAGTASIIGSLISLWVLIQLQSVKKLFLRRARLPEIINTMRQSSGQISSLLDDWPINKRQLEKEFSTICGALFGLNKKLPKKESEKVDNLIIKIQRKGLILNWRRPKHTKEYAWKIYADLSELIEIIDALHKDDRWK